MRRSLINMFWESAERYEDRTAIIQDGRRISYNTLADWAAAIASFLRSEGLKQGDRVSVLIPNSPEYVTVYYGVLAAGGTVVPLNTAAKARDLSNWVSHSESSWLVAQAVHPELKPLLGNAGAGLRLIRAGPSGETGDNTGTNLIDILSVRSDDRVIPHGDESRSVGAIVYTSGTTGRPKGVMLSHFNLYSIVGSILEYLKLTHDDKVMNVLPFYYIYGNSVLHTHLAVGGSIVLENSMLYPHRVLERMVEERVTGFSGVPSTFGILLKRTRLEDYDLSSLRYLTQAGGAMAPANIQRARKAIPHAEFFVMYGQTEAAARLSYLPPDRLSEKMGSVGVAIPGVELDVQDEHGRSVPTGVTGEICARGPNVMLGYWKDPGLTNQVLRDGWLRTGDLAYRDEDGYLYIVGRSSEMIKSGAHRISPKDIEEVILELDDVEEVAVVGVPDDLLGQIIKAVVVLRAGSVLEKRRIQAHCKANLAVYKIPKSIEFAKELTKTESGKIRRFLLQEQPMEQS